MNTSQVLYLLLIYFRTKVLLNWGLSRKRITPQTDMDCPQDWPEPVISVQSLSETGTPAIPNRYIKPPSERPTPSLLDSANIPVVDLHGLEQSAAERKEMMAKISEACSEWGFFQVVNHGVSLDLLTEIKKVWKGFFHLPYELKKVYANSPKTYEGYGSRLGVEKGAILDWGDYFFLHLLPNALKDPEKWPALPASCRKLTEEYGVELAKLCETLLKLLSENLGLQEGYLQKAFGGEDVGVCLRVNFYPKCPQPDLTLGLSSHSDPGGLTLLLPDDRVNGLQVRRGDSWVTVQAAPNSIIVNIGDQIQVMSNAIYKSVEHRVVVNSTEERLSFAFFYNPNGDLLVGPAPDLVSPNHPPHYQPMSYNDYRLYIRTRGPRGKSQVESLKATTASQEAS